LEKKLASAQKAGAILSERVIVDLSTSTSAALGKGAMILHIGQTDGLTKQLAIHRPIGTTPKATEADWVMSPKAQIPGFIEGRENPFYKKTSEAVSNIKLTAAKAAGVLKENPDGRITYPDGTIRDEGLKKATELAEEHRKVQGAKIFTPTFTYGPPNVQKGERDYLNFVANNPEVQAKIHDAARQHDAYETQDPSTGQTQIALGYLSGIPEDSVQMVIMDVVRTGSYNAAKWDLLKVKPLVKDSPFASWAYSEGNMPQDKMNALKDTIQAHTKLRKEYHALTPQGKAAVAAETADQKKIRAAKLVELNKAVHDVNEAEKFKFELPKASRPAAKK